MTVRDLAPQRTMPKDAVHDHYDEVKVKEMRGEKAVEIMKSKCRYCGVLRVFSNVERKKLHLAAPNNGPGSMFRCVKVPPAVKEQYVAELEASNEKKVAPEAAEMEVEEQGGGGGGAPAGGPQLRLRIIAPAEPPAAAAAASPVAPAAAAVASPAAPAAP